MLGPGWPVGLHPPRFQLEHSQGRSSRIASLITFDRGAGSSFPSVSAARLTASIRKTCAAGDRPAVAIARSASSDSRRISTGDPPATAVGLDLGWAAGATWALRTCRLMVCSLIPKVWTVVTSKSTLLQERRPPRYPRLLPPTLPRIAWR